MLHSHREGEEYDKVYLFMKHPERERGYQGIKSYSY